MRDENQVGSIVRQSINGEERLQASFNGRKVQNDRVPWKQAHNYKQKGRTKLGEKSWMATGYSQELVLASSLTSSDSKSTSKKLPELKSVGSDPVYEDRPLRRNLTPDEREFLELMKSQSILLKFAKMCRLAMHAYKENYLKITVWADCVAFARHCESQKLKASEEYKQVVARKLNLLFSEKCSRDQSAA